MIKHSTPKSHHMFWALFGLWTLAVPKPLLDVLEAAPAYWTANNVDSVTICVAILILVFPSPIFLWCAYLVLKGRQGISTVGRIYFSVLFVVLLSLSLYHDLSVYLGKPLYIIPTSVLGSLGVLVLYWRRAALRKAVCVLGGAVTLLTPIFFLSTAPTRSLLDFSGTNAGWPETRVTIQNTPVVVIVFDELSLSTLVDESGNIHDMLFPNFHRLAQISNWFQNATTNYGTTDQALPSLLTGRLLTEGRAETSYEQFPRNLFTLVSAPDGVLGVEPVTGMCPPKICRGMSKSIEEALRLMRSDFWLIYQNIFVPDRYTPSVQPIPSRFNELSAADSDPRMDEDAADPIQTVSDWLRSGREESLTFVHVHLPHAPYLVNPDGTAYSRMAGPATTMLGWNRIHHRWDLRAGFQVVQAFQRYVLQAMYSDRILGRILNDLETTGLLESTTLIVTADHGVCFTPGEAQRTMEFKEVLVGENNAVPLFWKSSEQTEGRRIMKNAELIDVLPTLLENLGADPRPGEMDGQSLWASSERKEKIFGGKTYGGNVWPQVLEASRTRYNDIDVVQHASGSVFVRPARYAYLIGEPIDGAKVTQYEAYLDNPSIFRDLASYGKASTFSPNFVTGWLDADSPFDTVGIVINGVIADVVDVFADEFGKRRFASVFDRSVLASGGNDLRLVGLEFPQAGSTVVSLLKGTTGGFELDNGVLVNRHGERLQSDADRLVAAFDTLSCSTSEILHVKGWLGDRTTWTPPLAYLVVYHDEQQIARPSGFRPGFVGKIDGLARSGFDIYLRMRGRSCDPEEFRMFAIFDENTYAEMRNILGMQ